ncbi:hypothetical protein [Flavobacterium sp.]|uniref:hypothetical protein n=1 Tax=Flavobacterium sp. TaxID=239 RepID=UPI00375120BC
MKSTSENSYGARIGNAEKLATALQTFVNYQPQKPEFSFNEFNNFITQIKNLNNTVATKKQTYSLSVESRKQLFEKSDYSIQKILSPINATVKASFGKQAKEATDVASIIAKIRGANTKPTTTTDQASVSQSYQSYSSKTQFFADLITNLTNFGVNYNPSNNQLLVTNLDAIHTNATAANNQVMDSYSQLKQNNDTRISSYNQLSQIAIRIKDSIKSQYGNQSSEYNLVKGLKI